MPVGPDLSVFGRAKTLQDFQREQDALELDKKLKQAEIAKSMMPDIDKMGEVAFWKSAQGIELTPQERAAAQYVDAKSGGIMYNPVTGAATQKPRISERINIDGIGGQSDGLDTMFPPIQGGRNMPPAAPTGMGNPAINQGYGDIVPTIDESMLGGQQNEFDSAYQDALKQAAGNPKLQQSITESYLKGKMDYNVEQSKNAGFAQRMEHSLPTIENTTQAGTSLKNKLLAEVPVFGNKLVSPEYQQYDQAKRDIINAILRRESGAVISPSEFANAEKQYFPQYGDSPEVLAQKKINREEALSGIQRGAGSAYYKGQGIAYDNQPMQSNAPSSLPKKGSVTDGYMYMGGDPSNQSNWKKVK